MLGLTVAAVHLWLLGVSDVGSGRPLEAALGYRRFLLSRLARVARQTRLRPRASEPPLRTELLGVEQLAPHVRDCSIGQTLQAGLPARPAERTDGPAVRPLPVWRLCDHQ